MNNQFQCWCLLALLIAIAVLNMAAATTSIDLYVSATSTFDGSADGSFAKPFKSLAQVQREVRARSKLAANSNTPINVYLRGGRYELSSTLDFTSDDSGVSSNSTITYQAYCDPDVEKAAISVRTFPYHSGQGVPPRLHWNGVGNVSQWTGPVDSFAQMGVNRSANSLLVIPTRAQDVGTDIGTVCVDKNRGIGHTCYAQGSSIATCVSGCMTACQKHIARERFSDVFYDKFTHLFGKDLRKEEDCVETCSLSCRGCEKVVISGSKMLDTGTLTWTLDRAVTLTFADRDPQVLKIFRTDLSAILPALAMDDVPTKPEDFATFNTLYVDGHLMPRAGFPNCLMDSSLPAATLNCSYASVDVIKSQIVYNATTFSSRVSTWTNVDEIMIDLRPQVKQPASVFYSIASVDSSTATVQLGAGGSELSYEIFTDGPGTAWSASAASLDPAIRVENVLQELDSPGEWYFDASTRWLYLIPIESSATAASLANSVLEIPLLHQLIRVSGSRENQYITPTHAHTTLEETTSRTKTSNLRFRFLTFSGTQLHHLNIYERIPGSAWPMTRVAAVFLESVTNTTIEYCSFEKIGGNAVMVSGENDNIQIVNNNVTSIGSNGIAVLARRGFQTNSFHEPVLAHLLVPCAVNISFNQIHHFGQRVAHSAAVMVVGARQSTIRGNLVFDIPNGTSSNTAAVLFRAAAYHIIIANGANYDDGLPLIRSISNLGENAVFITPAPLLASQYEMTVPLLGFDINTVAKLVGAPECFSGSGRVGSLYGEPPFTYTNCSGCCSVHNNHARLRVTGSGIAWSDASSREVVVRPGETIDLAATASAYFNSIVDVYLGFYVVTPNQVFDLLAQAKWRILTRGCQYAEQTYQETCGGPCIQQDGCGSSNAALQQALGTSLACINGYEADPESLVCVGPFEAQDDCDGTGTIKSHLFYNCSINCFVTSCT